MSLATGTVHVIGSQSALKLVMCRHDHKKQPEPNREYSQDKIRKVICRLLRLWIDI